MEFTLVADTTDTADTAAITDDYQALKSLQQKNINPSIYGIDHSSLTTLNTLVPIEQRNIPNIDTFLKFEGNSDPLKEEVMKYWDIIGPIAYDGYLSAGLPTLRIRVLPLNDSTQMPLTASATCAPEVGLIRLRERNTNLNIPRMLASLIFELNNARNSKALLAAIKIPDKEERIKQIRQIEFTSLYDAYIILKQLQLKYQFPEEIISLYRKSYLQANDDKYFEKHILLTRELDELARK